MAETRQGMSQNETLMHRAVSVAVAVALAGSMANFGIAAKAYAEETANTNANADNAALVADNTNANENEGSEASLMANDRTTLQKNLSAAESAVAKKALYTSTSWTDAALETAIEAGNSANTDSADQDTVDAAATALQTALDKLVEKTVSNAISAFKTRFAKTGDNKSLDVTTNTDYAAYAFYHIDKGATIDTATLATNFKADSKATTDIVELSRWILTLTGAGLDATKLDTTTYGDGNGNLVTTLESLIKTTTVENMTAEQLAWALPVYQNYSDTNKYAANMVTKLAALETADTTNNMFGVTDYATVARAILALAPYCDEDGTVYDADDYVEAAATAETSALTALKKGQNSEDGGFVEELATGTTTQATVESSVETTSQVVAALVAAGKDPEGTDYTTTDGDTPVSYLLAEADDDYKYSTTYQATAADEPGVAAMVFEALEADQQYTTNKEAFDVLEFPVTTTKTTTNTNTTKTTTTTTTAKTGDNGLLLGAAGVIAAAAAGTVVFSRRRENNNK